MTIKQLEKLFDTKEQENINLACNVIINQLSLNNVYTLLSFLKSKYSKILINDDDLKQAIVTKLNEDNCLIPGYNDLRMSVPDIFQYMLTHKQDIKQLKEVKEYYFTYIDSMIEQFETYNKVKVTADERDTTYF